MFIYIMGRGHSGSTILDLLLGNASQVQSVGEFISGVDRYDALCACGQRFRECDFWKRVRREFEERTKIPWDEAAAFLKKQAHVKRFVATLLSRSRRADVAKLRMISDALSEAITRVSGKPYVLDSSKESTRALFLARHVPEAKIIHLVRHPERVLASHYWRIERGEGFRFLRRTHTGTRRAPLFLTVAAITWVVGNLMGEVVRLIAGSRVLLVRYEDLCKQPRQELSKIGQFLEADLSSVIRMVEAGEYLAVGHSLAGNRIRRQDELRFDPSRSKQRALPRRYALLVKAVCWPLMLRYGYGVFRG